MSENHEVEQGAEESSVGDGDEPSSEETVSPLPEGETGAEQSDGEIDDLFLSPDDSSAEEVEFVEKSPEAVEPKPPEDSADGAAQSEQPPQPELQSPVDEETRVRLGELETERDDLKNRMLRAVADLENYRKRSAREKEDMRKYGIDRVVLELLPVLDNLERALEHADKSADNTTIVDGIRMVQRQFVGALEKHGVKGFDSKGEMFDPQKHEAIQQVETAEHETGTVLEEYQKGYYLHERLIRPALVVVARRTEVTEAAPAAPADPEKKPETSEEEAGEGVADSASETSEGSDESPVS